MKLPFLLSWMIRTAALLVPRGQRSAWRREWEAELGHRWGRLGRWNGAPAARRHLVRQAGGAYVDAAWLQARGLREGILLDLKHALRRFRHEPGFVVSSVLLIAVGIGASATIFSIVHSVILSPLPYPDPGRLVRIWETRVAEGLDRQGPSPGDFQYWRRHAGVFDGIASWYVGSMTVQDAGPAEIFASAQVSNDFFRLLQVEPLLGRTFTDEEVDRSIFSTSNTHVGEDPVVVISHRLWRQRFGADPAIVGSRIRLERKQWLVVGVMPPAFSLPDPRIDLWIPWSFARERPRDQRYTRVIARLVPGITLDEARSRMQALSREMAARFPETNRGWGVRLEPLKDDMVGDIGPALWSLFAAVGGLLIVVCLNVGGLQLVRASARHREIAVRVALGASRVRLVRQHLMETMLLAGAGGGLGLLLAHWGVASLQVLPVAALPRLDEIVLDGPVVAYAFAATLLAVVVAGAGPAIGGSRTDIVAQMKGGGETATSARARRRLGGVLVVCEVAMAVVLMAGAGLLGRSLMNLRDVDPGFSADDVLVFPIMLNGETYTGGGSRAYYQELTRRLAALPGVEAAGGATALPLSPVGPDFSRPVWRPGREAPAGLERLADIRMVTPDYFETLGIPLRRGRSFDRRDGPDGPRVVIISETLARQHWGAEDPVGDSLIIDYSSTGTYPYTVVGIVGDVRFHGPRSPARAELYLPHAQRPYLVMNMAVRASDDTSRIAGIVREAVLAMDKDQPVHSITPLWRLAGDSVEKERLSTLLMAIFAVIALSLSAVGLYGLVSYEAGRRSREIGIRMAMGATSAEIRRMVIGRSLPPAMAGLILGMGGAFALTGRLSSQLYGMNSRDPLTFAAVAVTLLAAAVLAGYLPARRASRLDPMRVLRHI